MVYDQDVSSLPFAAESEGDLFHVLPAIIASARCWGSHDVDFSI
jgi:hypothetical protein